jgi:diaminopimelate decarboxylase
MAGLGRIPRFSVDLETDRGGEELEKVDLVGPLCTPLDCVGRNIEVPPLARGDLVSIPNVGAYGLTGSLVAFLSRSAPLEIVHRGEEVRSVMRLAVRQENLA